VAEIASPLGICRIHELPPLSTAVPVVNTSDAVAWPELAKVAVKVALPHPSLMTLGTDPTSPAPSLVAVHGMVPSAEVRRVEGVMVTNPPLPKKAVGVKRTTRFPGSLLETRGTAVGEALVHDTAFVDTTVYPVCPESAVVSVVVTMPNVITVTEEGLFARFDVHLITATASL
jgi:hypothetical protein